jgi:hypothetical protein
MADTNMTIYAQKFITPFVSGGIKIKCQQDASQNIEILEERSVLMGHTNLLYIGAPYWNNDQWIGCKVVINNEQEREIIDNDWEMLIVDSNWDPAIQVGDWFKIFLGYGGYSFSDLPLSVKISLYEWTTNYNATIATTALVQDLATTASITATSNAEYWLYLFWKELAAGTYLWTLEVEDGYEDGSFNVLYDTDSVKYDSWFNGVAQSGDFESTIFGLDAESYESVMCVDDTFTGGYVAAGDCNVQVNRNTLASPDYGSIYRPQQLTTLGGIPKGRVVT